MHTTTFWLEHCSLNILPGFQNPGGGGGGGSTGSILTPKPPSLPIPPFQPPIISPDEYADVINPVSNLDKKIPTGSTTTNDPPSVISRIRPTSTNPVIIQATPTISSKYPILPNPTQSLSYVGEISSQVALTQQNITNNNQKEINVDDILNASIRYNVRGSSFSPLIYDPKKTFFKLPENDNIISKVNNSSYRNIFRQTVCKEVKNLLTYRKESKQSWDESDIQTLSYNKLIFSLREDLVEAFSNLRNLNGNIVGINLFLDCLKKHLLTGTIDEFNEKYYLNLYKIQKSKNFINFNKSSNESSNQIFSLLHLKDSRYNLTSYKDGWQENIEMGRFRFLNEDLDVQLRVTELDGGSNPIPVPNEGIPITFLTPKSDTTPASVGSPSLLNIGDGGGYYFQSTLLDLTDKAVLTSNLADVSYYAPPYVKSNLLSINNANLEYVITAKSLNNQHEFVSGDAGASALTPLYFGINLNSVSSYSFNDGVVESYSASYSRIVNEDSIQKHINNNALSISELYVDYRDPLYRYILDTSSLDMKSSDISSRGFVANPTIIQTDNFVKNVPFGFIVIPCQGSDFNPFNGSSKIVSYGDYVERELAFEVSLDISIEPKKRRFETYNTYLEDGSKRIGSYEKESVHNFGYRYHPSSYLTTYYSDGAFNTSSDPVSSYGASYLLREVIDYIKDEYNPSSIVWFDVFSRMPLTRVGELSYDLPEDLLEKLSNGYRSGFKIQNAQINTFNPVSLLEEDSKTIVRSSERPNYY